MSPAWRWWYERARWQIARPFRAARLALRSLNYEPQHIDPWGADAERIYDDVLPATLPAPDFEPVLSAPRIVGGTHITSLPDPASAPPDEVSRELAHASRAREPDLLLGEAWLRTHWWWYSQERQREADDYHNWFEADRREWRRENGLAAVDLVAA